MTFTAENIFFLGAVLIFASIVISKWGYRFGVPTLLLFLFTGMLFGSDGLGLEFNSHEDAQLIGMLSLSVILFSGGMDTKRRDIEPVASQGLMLSTVGVLITTVVTGLLIYYLLKELQATGGNVDMGTLTEYVTKQVKRQSVVINNKKQTPMVIPSQTLSSSWRNMKLK
ncbi:MAG: cation:proton antiporter [Prevotella sp.]|nr:cation:proton antiporter [Prevotella sp.]